MKTAGLSLVLALLALPLAADELLIGPPACALPAGGLPSGDIERVKIADNLWVESSGVTWRSRTSTTCAPAARTP